MNTWNPLSSLFWKYAVFTLLMVYLITCGESATAGVYFIRSPQPIVAPPGDRVVFECATNVPPERVVWLRNQVEYSSGNINSNKGPNQRPGRDLNKTITASNIEKDLTLDSPKPTVHLVLRISKNPQRFQQQAGDYQCVAWFGAVALTSLPAKLSIASIGNFPQIKQDRWTQLGNFSHLGIGIHSGPGRPLLQTNMKDNDGKSEMYFIEAFVGETIILPCPPPPSDPPAIITFYKDGNQIVESGRIRLLSSGNLLVMNGSQHDNGHYTCTASNHITAEVIDSKRILNVNIKNTPAKSQSPAILWQPEERYFSQIGRNVTLECAVSGWPQPTVYWTRERNLSLPIGRSIVLGGSLLIHNLVAEDEGHYSCEATSTLGSVLKILTLLELAEPVSLIKTPKDSRIEEGGTVSFDCFARGKPSPQHSWFFNGHILSNDSHITILDYQLIITNISKSHAGIFQCFVTNSLNKVEGSAATLEVVPRPQVAPFQDEDDDNEDEEDLDVEDSFYSMTTPQPTKMIESKMRNSGNVIGGKGRKGKHRPREMIPPSRPNITRLTDESVMVHWSVPPNEGLPIEFFKVQYKEADKRGSRWRTIDEDIPAHIRSYEVTSLKASQTYRFRIAAVYSNNDNKLGPNSGRFVLEKEPPKRKPAFSPLIDTAEAVSQSAIMMHWKYPDLDAIPLEGFFIYYRSTASAGDYTKVTVLGSNTRSHIVTHLLPETHYDLKMQAFSLTGTSEFSRIVTAKTQGSILSHPSSTYRSHNGIGVNNYHETNKHLDQLDIVSSDTSVTNDTIYVVLGSVLGGLTVLVVLLVALYHCRQRTQSNQNHTVWNDIDSLGAKQINETNNMIVVSNNSHLHKKLTNGRPSSFVVPHDPLYVDASNQSEGNEETVETSFCHEGNHSLNHRPTPVALDSQRMNENLPLNRFARNGSPCLVLPHSRKIVESNTLPLLRHNGMRDPCLEDADWEASVPAADSEKFI